LVEPKTIRPFIKEFLISRLRLLVPVAAWLLATPAAAQSLTAGELSGTVTDSSGHPLDGADVTVRDLASGVTRSATTVRTGRFQFALLPAGEYEVFAERLGYRPRRVRGVPVRPGGLIDVPVPLTLTPPPVSVVDSSVFAPGVLQGGAAGSSQWFTPFAIAALPDRTRGLNGLGRLSTVSGEGLETEGLPGGLSGIVLDGIPFVPARHATMGASSVDGAAFPLGAYARAELVTAGADVEWSGFGAGFLSGFARRGGGDFSARAFADWTGSTFSSSKYFNTGTTSNSSLRGGFVLAGPVIRDTAHFLIGVEARRVETPLPPAWGGSAVAGDSVFAVARDSFGTDLTPYTRSRVSTSDVVSAFGRFDWQLSPAHALTIGATLASTSGHDPDLGAARAASPGATLDATDFLAGATLSSVLGRRVSQELRVGVEGSTRDYAGGKPPVTGFAQPGVLVGSDAALPGRFRRTAIVFSEAVHVVSGTQRFKFGATVTLPSYDQTYAYGRSGAFTFGDASQFAARTGVFTQTVGPSPVATFSVPQFGGFVQNTITPSPGFDFVVGLRFDAERLPTADIRLNTAWQQATGVANTDVRKGVNKIAPRLGFTWDVGTRHTWLVNGEGGIYFDSFDPAVLTELITLSGAQRTRRGVGVLGPWPVVPDSTRAPVLGPLLTLLGPDFEPPRSRRFGLGISGALGRGLVLRLSGAYRHTDFLPRRHDLNRLPGATGGDQYGRPIYGTLVQQGAALTVLSGSNRRFPAFDLVSALDPDGFSDYRDFTVALERTLGSGLNLWAAYTYSHTTDNWLSGRGTGGGPAAQLTPFPDSLAGADWARGTSDFDVPHRVVVAADVPLRRLHGLHLAALYRYRSGDAFTPGFRDGVDANGDGSDRNDPAFVDDTLAGMSALLGKWGCLRAQAGRFADRNSCRAPGVHSLDLRLELPLARVAGAPFALVVDAVNIVESDAGVRDHALVLVDPTRSIVTNGTTGVSTIPLVANPDFGAVLVHRSDGRFWRLGLRVNW
jgi:carboxypeptidase family protein